MASIEAPARRRRAGDTGAGHRVSAVRSVRRARRPLVALVVLVLALVIGYAVKRTTPPTAAPRRRASAPGSRSRCRSCRPRPRRHGRADRGRAARSRTRATTASCSTTTSTGCRTSPTATTTSTPSRRPARPTAARGASSPPATARSTGPADHYETFERMEVGPMSRRRRDPRRLRPGRGAGLGRGRTSTRWPTCCATCRGCRRDRCACTIPADERRRGRAAPGRGRDRRRPAARCGSSASIPNSAERAAHLRRALRPAPRRSAAAGRTAAASPSSTAPAACPSGSTCTSRSASAAAATATSTPTPPSELGGGVSRGAYADTVLRELRLAADVLGDGDAFGDRIPAVSSIFFGGGTPTLLPAEHLAADHRRDRRAVRAGAGRRDHHRGESRDGDAGLPGQAA